MAGQYLEEGALIKAALNLDKILVNEKNHAEFNNVNLQLTLAQTGNSIRYISNAQRFQLETLAGTSMLDYQSANAQSILRLLYGTTFEIPAEVEYIGKKNNSTEYFEYGNVYYNALGKNYPDPFQSNTTIPFHVKEANELIIRIFDVKGQLVKELKPDPTTQQVIVNMADMNKGVYYYQLLVDGNIAGYEKMVLVE